MTTETWTKKGRDIRIYRYLWVSWARRDDANPAMFPNWKADEALTQAARDLNMSRQEVQRGINNLVQRGLASRWEDEIVTSTPPRIDTMMPLSGRDQQALRMAPGNVLIRAYVGELLDYLRRVDTDTWLLPHAAVIESQEADESVEVRHYESLGNRPKACALVMPTGAIRLVWSDGTFIHEITPSNFRHLERVLAAAQEIVAARQKDRRLENARKKARLGPAAHPNELTGIERQMAHEVYEASDGGLGMTENKLLENGIRNGLSLDAARAAVRKLVRLNRVVIDHRSGMVHSVPRDWHRIGQEPEIDA